MELDDNTKTYLCYIMNLNESKEQHPNVGLVKEESNKVLFALMEHEVPANKSETVPKEEKLLSPSSNSTTLEAEIINNWPLELKSEIPNWNCYVENDANAFIKQELLHEEVDIKIEDETHLDDKHNLGNKLSKSTRIFREVQRFKCSSCDYSSKQKSNFKRHLSTHTGEKPFKCHICGYSCIENATLKTHLRTHTGERPFKCNVCDYSCARNGDLKMHFRIHTGEKPLKCNVCDYSCAQTSDLKKHLRIHTGERPFKCSICDYRCAQNSTLRIHLRIHTGEKPFKCNICDYRFARNSSLKKHLKTH